MESDEPVRLAKCAHALWINRFLLEEHIVFDENLYEKLKLMRVLPDTMIGDVKFASKENKVEVLIAHVSKMGARGVRRFYDVLSVVGCDMVAEHLRFNAIVDFNANQSFLKEICEKFPRIKKLFSQLEMNTFSQYVQDKITEQTARRMWLAKSNERRQLLAERRHMTSTEIRHETVIQDYHKQIETLMRVLQSKDTEIEQLQREISSLQRKIKDLEKEHSEKERLLKDSTQACERSHDLMKERLNVFNSQIRVMNVKMRRVFGESEENIENDVSNIKLSKLEDNLERLFTHIGRLERETKRVLNRRNRERKQLLAALNIDQDQHQDLLSELNKDTLVLFELLQDTQQQLMTSLAATHSQDEISDCLEDEYSESVAVSRTRRKTVSFKRLIIESKNCLQLTKLLQSKPGKMMAS